MKRFRYQLSALLWLVAIVAAVLWGIRYRQYREAMPMLFIYRGGKTIVRALSPDFLANATVVVYRGQERSHRRGKRPCR